MALTVIFLLIVALVALPYAMYRATRKWGAAILWFFPASVCFLDSSGILAEHLWGPRWAWNFAHHDSAWGPLVQGLCALSIGLYFLSTRRRAA